MHKRTLLELIIAVLSHAAAIVVLQKMTVEHDLHDSPVGYRFVGGVFKLYHVI